MTAYLTFDDGPNENGCSTMNDMLDVLEKHGVPASFFLIGNKIADYNRDVILRAVKSGCSIENHSWSHPDMSKDALTENQILEEINKTDAAIESVTGRRPQFFRPPYLSVNELMKKIIPHTFILGHPCDDWLDEVGVEERLEKMLSGAKDGVVFLLHVGDGNSKTVEVVDRAIPILKERGFVLHSIQDFPSDSFHK